MANLWFEMGVVALSLQAAILIGMYFGKGGRVSLKEYMLGSRRMTVVPISLSLAATFLTGSSMVTTAQEVYMFGFQPAFGAICYAAYGIWLSWVYLPVSYSIKSASAFEFFDRRFNNRIRKFASVVYVFETIHHTAIAQMIPSLAISQVTGYPVFLVACGLSAACFVYTASGGLKAVANADGVQAVTFMTATVVLFFVGLVLGGGPYEIFQKAVEGSRMEFFNFDPSFEVKYSAIAISTGALLLSPNLYLSPPFHQRVAAMPTFEKARAVAIWSSIFSAVFLFFSFSMGLVIYAYFAGCDPVLAGKGIANYQSILPYFVEVISDKIPGILGLFLSGLVAAGLSTTTSCWNTVACTIYEDLVAPYLKPNVSKQTSFRILNGILLAVAIISTGIIPLIQGIKSILEATLALKALSTSMFYVLYNAGMCLPWVNSTGALSGSVVSGLITLYITIATQSVKSQHLVVDLPKILTTAQCVVNGTTLEALNMTMTVGTQTYGVTTESDPGVFWLHKFSMFYFMLPGAIIGLLVAYLVSVLTGPQNLETVDREMIIPQMWWVLPPKTEPRVGQTEEQNESAVPLTEYTVVPQIDIVE